jgi:hypothetical protein
MLSGLAPSLNLDVEYIHSIPPDMRQVTLYGEADIVITAHAGSMTNAQFMKPRSVLIEIGQYHKKVPGGCPTQPLDRQADDVYPFACGEEAPL